MSVTGGEACFLLLMLGPIPSDILEAPPASSAAQTLVLLGQLCLKGSRPRSPGMTPRATDPQTARPTDFSETHPSQETGTANPLCL